jgi:hypothetical protein
VCSSDLIKQDEQSPIEIFKEVFGKTTTWLPAIKERVHGWDCVRTYLSKDTATQLPRMLVVGSYNASWFEDFRAAEGDKNNPGDIDTPDDHTLDETRYFLQWYRQKKTNEIARTKNSYPKIHNEINSILSNMKFTETGI